MKPLSPALAAFLATLRTSPAPILMAECFAFTLADGSTLNVTNADLPVTCDGVTYLANTLLVEGLKYRADRTCEADSQQITISAAPTDTFGTGSTPFVQQLVAGLFDGALLTRKRAFMRNWSSAAVGSVTMFVGRISTIDEIGRVSAKVTVASDLAFLDIDMPRRQFSSTCTWTLYAPGCNLSKGAFTTAGTAGAGSTAFQILWSGALLAHRQGRLTWTSGANEGLSITVGSVQPGVSLIPIVALPEVPASGDAFTVAYGCDHTRFTCRSQFNNLANYRGFDFVPPPIMAI